jgi:hypothetical protein
MMAKMFYTMEETKAALGKSEEEIKQLAREQRLREFRDGPRLMFKADQVEQLKAELGGSGGSPASLGPSDTGTGLAGLDVGTSGSGITLLSDSQAGKPVPGAQQVQSAQAAKEDTAFADIGLSGTIGGVPSPGKVSPGAGTGLSGLSSGGHGSKGGITVFDADEAPHADPRAQTAIGSGIQDQVNIEGVGSGSGLLDLTRESDDTSLGAVFDELAPTRRKAGTMMEVPSAGSSAGMAALGEPLGRLAQPIVVEEADPVAPAFGAMALAGALIVAFGGLVVAAAILDHRPQIVKNMYQDGATYVLIGLAVVIVFGVIGFVIGKQSAKNQ